MHRTQLMLEDWQYEALKSRAEGAGVSISELVRRAIAQYLEPPPTADDPLLDLCGMIDGDGEPVGRDHDKYIYVDERTRRR